MTQELPKILQVYSEHSEECFVTLATIYGYTGLVLEERWLRLFEPPTDVQYAFWERIRKACSRLMALWSGLAVVVDCRMETLSDDDLRGLSHALHTEAVGCLGALEGYSLFLLEDENLDQMQRRAARSVVEQCECVSECWKSILVSLQSSHS